ncbi:hypothetical protein JYU34_013342 [Plutella xylostella]|uniref:2'-phosphotransferase n=1 Tax=Plutella xylostella TaxID=51655 RepID=A0ABQ7QAY3_PLUXY|nr:hypothetical protein JYU34_013342 [Plutella xylostella]
MTNKSDIKLSKALSWILRHGAVKEGLTLSPEGYTPVASLLQHRLFKGQYKITDIERVVETNDKQRFKLRVNPLTHALEIRSNQGHSLSGVSEGLTPIIEAKYPTVVHGTYLNSYQSIKKQGLSRMSRQHIHFAKGTPGDKTVISGLRRDAEVFIYLDLQKALDDGLKFFESENGVILTAGNEDGYILPKYFLKVTSNTGATLT